MHLAATEIVALIGTPTLPDTRFCPRPVLMILDRRSPPKAAADPSSSMGLS